MIKSRKKALAAQNYDLFATVGSAGIDQAGFAVGQVPGLSDRRAKPPVSSGSLPSEAELYRLFHQFNLTYFQGRLPEVTIVYSNRMRSAGSYQPDGKLIKVGRKYHEIFPEDIHDTLKHEMIHILNLRHDAAFRAEALRIGATVRAQSHPSLRRLPKYLYVCPNCRAEYPRQKRLRMASCGTCSPGGKYNRNYKLKLLKK